MIRVFRIRIPYFSRPMSKIRAFLLHLSISATIVGIVLAIIFWVWYPSPFFEIAGANQVLKILIAVDLILGPLLTLILYRPGKPKVIFDLSVIAIIQLSALIYGVVTIYSERPYYVVFAVDRFEVLAKKDVEIAGTEDPQFITKPWTQPIYAVAVYPEGAAERNRLLEEVVFQGLPDIDKRPEYWRNYQQYSDAVADKAKPLSELPLTSDESRARVESVVKKHTSGAELVYVPVMGKQGPLALVLNPENRLPVAAINIDPWEAEAGAS